MTGRSLSFSSLRIRPTPARRFAAAKLDRSPSAAVLRKLQRIVDRGHRAATLAHLTRQTISKASKCERVTDGLLRWLESSHYLVFGKYQGSNASLVIRRAHAQR